MPFVWIAIGLLLLWPLLSNVAAPASGRAVDYSAFLDLVDDGRIAEVEFRGDEIAAVVRPEGAPKAAEGEPAAEKAEGERIRVERLPGIDDDALIDRLRDAGAVFRGRVDRSSGAWLPIVAWLLPLAFLAIMAFGFLRATRAASGPFGAFKGHAKLYDASRAQPVTFADVAGVDEAKQELEEVVDFLRRPERYADIGARIPRGVLLVGPPGTGKTLLARAVAGEAGVPFFSLSGSEFVEMFVGLGAKRIRELFEQAKAKAPCIVFIDEIDAIGKHRGGMSAIATHDEREQTLNQLLAEMDGFVGNQGVIVIAATNRPEVLDRALLRPGRFDRQVLVDRPEVRGREMILRVHAGKLRLSPSVDLRLVAQRTPLMSGADLANIVNEAAIAAARTGATAVERRHFEQAIDRVQLGLERRGKVLGERDKKRVAIHEAGHALAALSVDNADPVHRVTIIPRSIGALGGTLQLPTDEKYLMTEGELRDRICVYMGGTVAEEIVLGEISSGAANDLERATELARLMVTRFGMGRLAPRTYGRPESAAQALVEERGYAEETARAIDAEIAELLEEGRSRARVIVRDRRDALDRVVARLLEAETIEGDELLALAEASSITRQRATGS
jgi:cell division protease FtsH